MPSIHITGDATASTDQSSTIDQGDDTVGNEPEPAPGTEPGSSDLLVDVTPG